MTDTAGGKPRTPWQGADQHELRLQVEPEVPGRATRWLCTRPRPVKRFIDGANE